MQTFVCVHTNICNPVVTNTIAILHSVKKDMPDDQAVSSTTVAEQQKDIFNAKCRSLYLKVSVPIRM